MRSTTHKMPQIVDRILLVLNQNQYNIINTSTNSITFRYNIWRIGSRSEGFETINKGKFEIQPSDESLLILTYFTDPTFEILISAVAIIVGIVEDDYYVFLFIIFSVLIFILRWINMKHVANRMIENIANGK